MEMESDHYKKVNRQVPSQKKVERMTKESSCPLAGKSEK